ncbi:uncharacterized protein LOC131941590 isoform X2 [Physella acuta]|uniref:uncharacterized protein LOC131941590 isoform X1 n=1 Tax=Physella acuta TaxID=109671 RepID=UPI0027DE9014|nr:uncharacterized protein LOC131941590 isoform X1 [Physella acuta]XP_059156890.1 uncharacterized protein LOC131941590 isoform X2 [Physella acuta]
MHRIGIILVFCALTAAQLRTQDDLNLMARVLKVSWTVVTNTEEVERYNVELTLQNDATNLSLSYGPWKIYFDCIYMIEPDLLGAGGNRSALLVGQGVKVTHVQGTFFILEPSPAFSPMPPKSKRKFFFKVQFWSVSRTDNMPNWYLAQQGFEPAIIESTRDLSYVADKTTPAQWKRFNYDYFNPFTSQERYDRNYIPLAADDTEVRILPKPVSLQVKSSSKLTIDITWYIGYVGQLASEASYLGSYIGLPKHRITPGAIRPAPNTIGLRMANISLNAEAYTLTVNASTATIHIIGQTAAGVFYGIVSLIALMNEKGQVPEVDIVDSPRFGYRGLMLDIARNFHDKGQIIRILEWMGKLKLNVLHLHLTDDEGWRLEVPDLPELVQLGSRRCHDVTETQCLLPQLGSGPRDTPHGSGHLNSSDYREILERANVLHVKVIPEFDMPGHARAAIKAMKLRAATGAGNDTVLTEDGDPSVYSSPQQFTDNAINPCLESTYKFISIIMDEIIRLHAAGKQPLEVFHFGGDEVGRGAWLNSTACQRLRSEGKLPGGSPKWYFFQRVSQLAAARKLSLGAWEDGLILDNNPFNVSSANVSNVYAYAWDNVWEWGTIARTYTLANRGYKVVMAHASHLYFDHPYEPDPEERGYYWATRYTDIKKAFSYNAVRFYDNILMQRSGQPVKEEELCGAANTDCPPLMVEANIAGMEAALFSETTRTEEDLHDRLFPRLLAMAERAWHKAPWEDLPRGEERDRKLDEDWQSFVRGVGHRVLRKLEADGVMYKLPPPGGRISNGMLLTTPLFPGLSVQYSHNAGQTWADASGTVVRVSEDNPIIWLRTVSSDGSRFSRTVTLYFNQPAAVVNQPVIDYISQNLTVKFTVVDNYKKYGEEFYQVKLTFTNNGNLSIPGGNWRIYFPNVNTIEPDDLLDGRDYIDHTVKMSISHVAGYLYSVGPTRDFAGLDRWQEIELNFKISNWCVSRYEMFPRTYVSAPGMAARDIVSTVGEGLDYVTPFTKMEQWKRFENDLFDPWTPGIRYDRNVDRSVSFQETAMVLPPVVSYKSETVASGAKYFNLLDAPVTVVYDTPELNEVASVFKGLMEKFFTVTLTLSATTPDTRYIHFKLGNFTGGENSTEGYHVKVGTDGVIATARTADGAFYAAMTVFQLAYKSATPGAIPLCDITDWPRFPYRGMHVDVGRNFLPKSSVLKLLEVMAIYKMNKLHFHLSDDEGWRLEIPELDELTQIGSRRCHDLEEKTCVMSTLGSGSGTDNSGSGYYNTTEYREILRFAKERHIEVIPEFDMPGHAHAAIIAMRNRKQKLEALGDIANARLYDLQDESDTSHYISVQTYTDNAINPCIESTYNFINEVFMQVKKLHIDIQPLKVFHFGGDEVAKGAWLNSSACASLLRADVNLKWEFTRRVAGITKDVTLGAWEDGLMDHASVPWNRTDLPNKEIIAQAWQNVWEWGAGSRAYNLANAGYKVVFSPVTHTYLDHPQEPSPEERGLYWGTRYTDAYKTFSFMPDDYYLNADIQRSGEPISLSDICGEDKSGCPPLLKPENILGLQGQLWSETVRTPAQFEYMVFPRLLAIAERAWHKAPWEGKEKGVREQEMKRDWSRFARGVGRSDMAILDKLKVEYRVPPPGARQSGNKIAANVEFPDLLIQQRVSDSWWEPFDASKTYKDGQEIYLRSISTDNARASIEVKVKVTISGGNSTGSNNSGNNLSCYVFLLLLCCIFYVI